MKKDLIKKLRVYLSARDVAAFIEQAETNEKLAEIAEMLTSSVSRRKENDPVAILEITRGEKGETGEPGKDGYTPRAGIDFFTDDQKENFKLEVINLATPEKGVDYFTEDEVDDFLKAITPIKGKDYFTKSEIKEFKKDITPVKGKDYFDGEKGKDGSPDKPKDILEKLNTTEGELELKVLKGLKTYVLDLIPKTTEKSVKLYRGGTGGGGSSGGGTWGSILGTLSDQTDLQTALDAKQNSDADLTAIAALTPSNDDFLQRKAGAWTNRTVAQVKTDLGLIGTNSGDQTSIVGITGTKAQFDTAVTDGNFLYVGDITQYTDEMAQDAVGAMADANSLTYTDGTPKLEVKLQMSLTSDASGVKLSGDASTPGNSKYYGTDASGVKGYFAFPAGGSVAWGDLTGTLSDQTDLQTVLDAKIETLGDLGVTSTASELNILDGATLTVTELNYVDGVTSAIQTQLDAKAAAATTITIAGTAEQIVSSAGAQSLAANRTWTISLADDISVVATITTPNTGLHILDTNASHDLILKPGSDLTADHTLTLTTGDSDRTITLSGNPTLADWFDQSVKAAASPQFAAIELNHASANTLTASGGHMTIEGATVWDSGNDGASSGLDADLLDGKNTGTSGNTVPLLDGTNTWSGQQTISLGSAATTEPLRLVNTTDNASVQVMQLEGDRATMANNDEAYVSLLLSDSGGTQTEFGRLTWRATTVTDTSEAGRLAFSVMTGGSLAEELYLTGTALSPAADGGNSLGTTALGWQNLFGNTGFVFNLENGDWVATHTAGILTVGTGDLRVTNAGSNSASVVTVGGSQTLTNKTLTTPVINGTITGTGQATVATASTIAMRDANGNSAFVNVLEGYTTTATAAGTTTLTVSSNNMQYFTGSTTQTVVMPVASTLVLGQSWWIVNLSTGAVTVNSSGGNAIIILAAGTCAEVTCILTSGTNAASWNAMYIADIITSGKKLSVSNTITLAGTDGTTMTFPSTSATIARTDAANTFSGTQTFNGTVALGTQSITMTGSIASTGSRVTKGWFTDLEVTNDITINGTALATTYLAKAGGTLTGSITLGENTGIALDPAGSADGKWSGVTIAGTGGATIAFGDLVTLDKDDSRWELVDISVAAAATGDARGILGMAVTSSSDGGALTVLLQGQIRADANFPALTIGAPVYASTTGDIVVTQPTTVDHVIRIIGYALTADEIYFFPDGTWTTHT